MRPQDKAKLYKIRSLLDKYLSLVVDEPAAINDAIEVIYEWKPGTHALNDVRRYQGIPYKCIQAHDSANEVPSSQSAFWQEYHGTDKASAREWNSQAPYRQGEWVVWIDGKLYECLINDTTSSPAESALAWKEVEA